MDVEENALYQDLTNSDRFVRINSMDDRYIYAQSYRNDENWLKAIRHTRILKRDFVRRYGVKVAWRDGVGIVSGAE